MNVSAALLPCATGGYKIAAAPMVSPIRSTVAFIVCDSNLRALGVWMIRAICRFVAKLTTAEPVARRGLGVVSRGVEDTWTNRDLPVLRAAVVIYDKSGRANIRVNDIERAVEFDKDTIQRALRALSREPFFEEEGSVEGQTGFVYIGAPTGEALRVAGQWPTPENMVERLIAAFEAAGDDETLDPPERSKAKQAALWLGDTLSKIAIGALGGAGGHALYS
jgi:hypothetical protein